MTDRLRVDFGSLAELTGGLLAAADALEGQLDELDTAIARIAESWQGEAHDRFHTLAGQWQGSSRDLHATLRKLHTVCRTAHGNYQAAEAASLRLWGAR
jgi:early secretory antigenic target protein ESAT-6